jgi:hypothetical protein
MFLLTQLSMLDNSKDYLVKMINSGLVPLLSKFIDSTPLDYSYDIFYDILEILRNLFMKAELSLFLPYFDKIITILSKLVFIDEKGLCFSVINAINLLFMEETHQSTTKITKADRNVVVEQLLSKGFLFRIFHLLLSLSKSLTSCTEAKTNSHQIFHHLDDILRFLTEVALTPSHCQLRDFSIFPIVVDLFEKVEKGSQIFKHGESVFIITDLCALLANLSHAGGSSRFAMMKEGLFHRLLLLAITTTHSQTRENLLNIFLNYSGHLVFTNAFYQEFCAYPNAHNYHQKMLWLLLKTFDRFTDDSSPVLASAASSLEKHNYQDAVTKGIKQLIRWDKL